MSLDDSQVPDPLRPRCRFNPEHVVADMKQKQRHEKRCPDNPRRESRSAWPEDAGNATHRSSPATPFDAREDSAHAGGDQGSVNDADGSEMDESALISDMSSQED
jgi:hypothetical protein